MKIDGLLIKKQITCTSNGNFGVQIENSAGDGRLTVKLFTVVDSLSYQVIKSSEKHTICKVANDKIVNGFESFIVLFHLIRKEKKIMNKVCCVFSCSIDFTLYVSLN